MRNYFACQKFERKGKLRFIYNSELCKEIGHVCVSEAGSQLSCVLEAVDAATEVDTYQRLNRDHSPLNHLPGIHCHYLLVLVMNYLTLLTLTQTSMHLALID